MKRAIFAAMIILLSVSNSIALPLVTFVEDHISINLMVTYFDSTRFPEEEPPGTIDTWQYSGSLFNLPFENGNFYTGWLSTTYTGASSRTSYSYNEELCRLNISSSVTLDDDSSSSGYTFIPGLTAFAISNWDTTFTVQGDGALAIIGSWSNSNNLSQLFDLTLGTSISWPSDNLQLLLQDGHTYRYFGHTAQYQIEGIGGYDHDSGYYLNFFNTSFQVPEPSVLLSLFTGLIILAIRHWYVQYPRCRG